MEVRSFKGSFALINMVYDRLKDLIEYYDCVSVSDYYDIIGVDTVYTDNKYGWISLDKVVIAMCDEKGMYELKLPKAILIQY